MTKLDQLYWTASRGKPLLVYLNVEYKLYHKTGTKRVIFLPEQPNGNGHFSKYPESNQHQGFQPKEGQQ